MQGLDTDAFFWVHLIFSAELYSLNSDCVWLQHEVTPDSMNLEE